MGIVAIVTASGSLIAVRPRTFANFLNSSGSIPFIIFCTTPETNSKIPHPSAFMASMMASTATSLKHCLAG